GHISAQLPGMWARVIEHRDPDQASLQSGSCVPVGLAWLIWLSITAEPTRSPPLLAADSNSVLASVEHHISRPPRRFPRFEIHSGTFQSLSSNLGEGAGCHRRPRRTTNGNVRDRLNSQSFETPSRSAAWSTVSSVSSVDVGSLRSAEMRRAAIALCTAL